MDLTDRIETVPDQPPLGAREAAVKPPVRGIKRVLPRSMMGRSLLIIVTPLVLLQVVSALIFYESHWDKVTSRLARSLAGDVAMIVSYLRDQPGPEGRAWIFNKAAEHMEISASLRPGEILPNTPPPTDSLIDRSLAEALDSYLGLPYRVDSVSDDRMVRIDVQLRDGVLELATTRKRLFSSTVYVFVLWMVGSSLILFGVATIFMRNQVRPIRRLAVAADNFGKGRDVARFKPEGATEVRRAAVAFMAMRERIQRQIRQRTDMLAGVSHDMRTPLTRMKLQLALMGDGEGIAELETDVVEMEHMLEAYLAFARGEGGEPPKATDLSDLAAEVVEQARRGQAGIELWTDGPVVLPLRQQAIRRCLANLVGNAARHADHVSVSVRREGDHVEVAVNDNGPGIPPDKREKVFRPFFRLDPSRTPGSGGVGLGLTIARDIARGHGGDVVLDESPLGGLRARLLLPM
ncbi:MAG: HAMP domain-containing protein [Rhodobacterales bacterium]|nr:HAMP domain-containing protein [Rhodobacterales bacterium]